MERLASCEHTRTATLTDTKVAGRKNMVSTAIDMTTVLSDCAMVLKAWAQRSIS